MEHEYLAKGLTETVLTTLWVILAKHFLQWIALFHNTTESGLPCWPQLIHVRVLATKGVPVSLVQKFTCLIKVCLIIAPTALRVLEEGLLAATFEQKERIKPWWSEEERGGIVVQNWVKAEMIQKPDQWWNGCHSGCSVWNFWWLDKVKD